MEMQWFPYFENVAFLAQRNLSTKGAGRVHLEQGRGEVPSSSLINTTTNSNC
jgi:hypothetical protein